MKPINEAAVTFLSRSANEGFARTAAACFAAQLDPTLDEINDIKTAVSEAVTNCIIHGYENEIHTIRLTAALDGDRTELVVRMGYWQADSREKVAQEVQQVRQERGAREEAVWIVHYYPETDPVGIIEFLLKPTEEEIQAYQAEQAAAAQSDAPTESEASSAEQAP